MLADSPAEKLSIFGLFGATHSDQAAVCTSRVPVCAQFGREFICVLVRAFGLRLEHLFSANRVVGSWRPNRPKLGHLPSARRMRAGFS